MLHPMFRRYPARLRFDVLPEGTPGAPAVPVPPVVPPVDLGFPADTAEKDMTDGEKVAYWKHHSRRHEAEVAKLKPQVAANADKAGQFDALALANASDAEKAVIAARAEGVTQGSAIYLADAVKSRLLLLTGKSEEDLAGALDLIDVQKLTTDGALDVAKVQALATSIGLAAPVIPGVPPVDVVRTALGNQQQSTTITTGSTIAEMQKQIIADANAATAAAGNQ